MRGIALRAFPHFSLWKNLFKLRIALTRAACFFVKKFFDKLRFSPNFFTKKLRNILFRSLKKLFFGEGGNRSKTHKFLVFNILRFLQKLSVAFSCSKMFYSIPSISFVLKWTIVTTFLIIVVGRIFYNIFWNIWNTKNNRDIRHKCFTRYNSLSVFQYWQI